MLLVFVSAILLAHRNDLGWWTLILSVFVGPMISALQYDLLGLIYAIPLLLLPIFGLWRFSQFKLNGKFTREVTKTPVTLWSAVGMVVGLILLVALRFGPFLFNSGFLTATPEVWVMYFADAAIFASFVMIARGVREGWLLLAVAAIADLVVYFLISPMLGMLGLYVFIALAAAYGYFLWRGLLPRLPSRCRSSWTRKSWPCKSQAGNLGRAECQNRKVAEPRMIPPQCELGRDHFVANCASCRSGSGNRPHSRSRCGWPLIPTWHCRSGRT